MKNIQNIAKDVYGDGETADNIRRLRQLEIDVGGGDK